MPSEAQLPEAAERVLRLELGEEGPTPSEGSKSLRCLGPSVTAGAETKGLVFDAKHTISFP